MMVHRFFAMDGKGEQLSDIPRLHGHILHRSYFQQFIYTWDDTFRYQALAANSRADGDLPEQCCTFVSGEPTTLNAMASSSHCEMGAEHQPPTVEFEYCQVGTGWNTSTSILTVGNNTPRQVRRAKCKVTCVNGEPI